MTKRQKFVSTALLLSVSFFAVASQDVFSKILGISAVSLFSVILFAWSLSDAVKLDASLLVLILPALFSFGVGSFWFLLPSIAIARVAILIFYAIGMYALALTSNIIAVSKMRKIALLRAAHIVNFIITLFTAFLLFDELFSLKTNIIMNVVLSFLISLLLILPKIWATYLTLKIEKEVIVHGLAYSYVIALLTGLLYFWPASVVVSSILLTVSMYVILGLAQAYHEERLFKETIREYMFVGILVFITMIISTSWRG